MKHDIKPKLSLISSFYINLDCWTTGLDSKKKDACGTVERTYLP